MITDDQLDDQIRALTRRMVDAAPLAPDLDLDALQLRRGSAIPRLALAAAAAFVLVVAGSVMFRGPGQTAVQTGPKVVPLERVERLDGTVVLRTPQLPDMQLTAQHASVLLYCLRAQDSSSHTCVRGQDDGLELAFFTAGPSRAVFVSTSRFTAMLEIEFPADVVRQQPVDGLGLVALPSAEGQPASMKVTIAAYDSEGVVIDRASITASD
jgi:hypothetical protein